MYNSTITQFSKLAKKKIDKLTNFPLAFFIETLLAGAHIGLGIILIFSVGGQLDEPLQKLVMGASFGIALTLVIFAGSELFTGHTMYMTFGKLSGTTSLSDLVKVWSASWAGNLIGSVILATIFVMGGGGELLHKGAPLLNKVAAYKMNSPELDLFTRAILCNWLVCLALWMSARVASDTTKCIVIFWCLFAFIASGYEHSVANMTLLSIALLGNHPETVSLGGMAHNLIWVTAGNIIGGSVFMGMAYWYSSPSLYKKVTVSTKPTIET